jgi:quercetin dioxygenase-like cupin family protein
MKRKQFLLTTMATLPAFAFAKIAAGTGNTKEPFIVRSGKNRSGEQMMKFMGTHPNDVVISRQDTGNAMSVFLFSGYGNAGTPLHVHFHQDEFFYVVDGQYRFVCGEIKSELNPGDTIFLPRNIPHQWLQLSENGKLLYAVNPAGTLEDMFKELNELKALPTETELAKMLDKHGQKLLGPPLKL